MYEVEYVCKGGGGGFKLRIYLARNLNFVPTYLTKEREGERPIT